MVIKMTPPYFLGVCTYKCVSAIYGILLT